MALYHTFIDALLGILWLLIVLAFLVGVTYFLARRSNLRWLRS